MHMATHREMDRERWLWGCEICEITGVSVLVPRAYASDDPEALHQK